MEQPLPNRCLDCDYPIDVNYYSRCGQKNRPAQLALTSLLKEVVGEVFDVDGRVPRTIITLPFRPGFLTREYNSGKRRH